MVAVVAPLKVSVNVPPVGVPVMVIVCCSLTPPSAAAEASRTPDSVMPVEVRNPSSGCGSARRDWRRMTPGMRSAFLRGGQVQLGPQALLGERRHQLVGSALGVDL